MPVGRKKGREREREITMLRVFSMARMRVPWQRWSRGGGGGAQCGLAAVHSHPGGERGERRGEREVKGTRGKTAAPGQWRDLGTRERAGIEGTLWEQTERQLGIGGGRRKTAMNEKETEEMEEKRLMSLRKAVEHMRITVEVEALIPRTLVEGSRQHSGPRVGTPMFHNIEGIHEDLKFIKVERKEKERRGSVGFLDEQWESTGGDVRGIEENIVRRNGRDDAVSSLTHHDTGSSLGETVSSLTRETVSHLRNDRMSSLTRDITPGHWRYRSKSHSATPGVSQVTFLNGHGRGHSLLGERLLNVCSSLFMREHFPHMANRDSVIHRFAGPKAVKHSLGALRLRSAASSSPPLEAGETYPFSRAIFDVLLSHAYEEGGLVHAYRFCQTVLFPVFTTAQARRSQGLIWALQLLAEKMPTNESSRDVQEALPREAVRVVTQVLGKKRAVAFSELSLDGTALLEKVSDKKRQELLGDLRAEPVHRYGLFVDDVLLDDGLGLSPGVATAAAARNFLAQVYSWPPSRQHPVRVLYLERKELHAQGATPSHE